VCVCVCVHVCVLCVGERERERERGRGIQRSGGSRDAHLQHTQRELKGERVMHLVGKGRLGVID
jgi:hypothetical protein